MTEVTRNTSIGTPVSEDRAYNERVKAYESLLTELKSRAAVVMLGGGEKRIKREHDRGKLTARERVNRLVDTGSPFLEMGTFAGDGMYEDEGGCPAAGTIMGLG
ncbi:MAG: acyl-CoA carboxylase subunit beta, partial [Rhodothermales bacterium]|nr:acyl-CoA carboxylase subunit beta [Rhodothermales bacterium]